MNSVAWGAMSQPAPRLPETPYIIHIQDAHSNYAAQKNICELIERFRKDEGIDLVFVEGAATGLDRKYLQFNPNPAINRKVTNKLARMGELSGADLYLLKENAEPVEFVGLEDISLYRQNLTYFRKVMSQEVASLKWIESERSCLDRHASRLGNKELLQLIRNYLTFQNQKSQFKPMLVHLDQLARKYLNRDLKEAGEQIEFPNLVRLLRLMHDESKINVDAVKKEAKEIEALRPSVDLREILGEKRSLTNPRFLLEQLYSELKSKKFDFQKYPNFSLLTKNRVCQYELKSEEVLKELLKLTSLLFDALAINEDEKALVQEVRNFVLVSKLITLELTREEWETKPSPFFPLPSKGRGGGVRVEDALAFYQAAILREKAFITRIQQILREKKKSRAIVITGGFHAKGLARALDTLGIQHKEILPEVKGDSRRNYVNTLLERYPSSAQTSHIARVEEALPPEERQSLGADIVAFQNFVQVLSEAASLGTKKVESQQEKQERRERVIDKMGKMLQVDKNRISKILDDKEMAQPSRRFEDDRAGWLELLTWAQVILSDLDTADAKYIDAWKKYNRRIDNLEKRTMSRKEKDAKYREIQKKKKIAKAKNKKLHTLAGQLMFNLRDFIDDEIRKAPGRKGLLRSIQIAPVQRTRRSIGKALRSFAGEEAQRALREQKFGVTALLIKPAESFIEEQESLFAQFQQTHSPKPSPSRRYQQIEQSSVSELDLVDGKAVVSDDLLDIARRRKKEGRSLGASELSQVTGLPVDLIKRFANVDVEKIKTNDPHAGTALLVHQVIKIDKSLKAMDRLLVQIKSRIPKGGKEPLLRVVIDLSVEGVQLNFLEAFEKLEAKNKAIHDEVDKFYRRLKRFWRTQRALAGIHSIVKLSKKDSLRSAARRVVQHVERDARQGLLDSVEEEGFLSFEKAVEFLEKQSKHLDRINQKLDAFQKSARLIQNAGVSGKSLGLAMLGHDVDGMHSVNRLMGDLLYPEDERVLGSKHFEQEIKLGGFWFPNETLLKAMEALTEKREGKKPFLNAA